MAENKELKLSEDQLQRMVHTATEAGARAAAEIFSQKPHLPTEQEAFEAAKGLPPEDRAPREETRIKCRTDLGASFTALVVPSRNHLAGRVVRIEDYVYPEPMPVPERMAINDGNGRDTAQYKQWKWQTFWQADLSAYVCRGKSCAGNCATRLPRIDGVAPTVSRPVSTATTLTEAMSKPRAA